MSPNQIVLHDTMKFEIGVFRSAAFRVTRTDNILPHQKKKEAVHFVFGRDESKNVRERHVGQIIWTESILTSVGAREVGIKSEKA